jgi:hypothetical protein
MAEWVIAINLVILIYAIEESTVKIANAIINKDWKDPIDE